MSEPIRRRVRHRAGATPIVPADPTRVVLRRRRCGEPPLRRRARLEGSGSAWRQVMMGGLMLLAAGPVWAIGEAVVELYHEKSFAFVRQTHAHLDWIAVQAPEVAVSGPSRQSLPAASHGGTGTFVSQFATAWDSATGGRVSAKTTSVAAHPDVRASVPAASAWWPGTPGSPSRPAFATASRPQVKSAAANIGGAAAVKPAFVAGTYTWTGLSAATPGTPDPSWTTANNWSNGTTPVAPPNNGSSTIEYTINPVVAAATNVNVNYSIAGLVYQGLTGTVGATDTPSYNITGSSGVSLTIGTGGITDNSANLQTITVPVVLGAAQTWNVSTAAGALAVNGAISGTNGITKTGAGTLTLSGSTPNTYTGLTSVTAGTLVLDKTLAVALTGNLSIGNATNPGAAGSVVTRLLSSAQTGGGTNVTLYSDGLLDLNNQGLSIGSLTMTGGEVRTGDSNLVLNGGSLTTNASASPALISASSPTGSVYLAQATTFNVARGTATYDLDVQADVYGSVLTKTGAGVLRLSGSGLADFVGSGVTLQAGTLALGADAALYPGTTLTLAGGTVTADGGNRTIANPVALTGNATIGDSLDGTPRAITFTGATTLVGSQTLTVNNTAATTFSGPVNLGDANTLTIDGTGNTLISGVVSDAVNSGGGLTKQGSGTLTLTANNPYSGDTVVSGGKLFVNNVPAKAGDSGTGTGTVFVGQGTWLGGTGVIGGNVAVGILPVFNNPLALAGPRLSVASGVLTPGVNGPGILTVNGGVTFASSGTLEADLAGPNPGTGYDQVKVGGGLTLSGTLTLTLGAGAKLFVGETFYLFDLTSTAGTVAGTFENAAAGGVFTDNAGDTFVIKYNDTDPADGNGVANDVSLTALTVPEPGTWAMLGLGAALGVAGMTRHRVAIS